MENIGTFKRINAIEKIEHIINFLLDKKLLIKLEAIIGVGKTTLCKSIYKWLSEYIPFKWYSEPIIGNFLDLFYSDVKKYAFSFQSHIMYERLNYDQLITNDLINYNLIISERSKYGDFSFGTMHYKSGNMTDQEFHIYSEIYNKSSSNTELLYINNLPIKTIIVYLSCSIPIARKRIIERGNQKEISTCTEEYLTNLDHNYKKILSNVNQQVIYIDYNYDHEITEHFFLDKETTFDILYEIIKQIH